MKLEHLAPEELAVVKWQYKLNGHFYTSLWDAICLADDGNLMRLSRGFPDEVNGYINYTQQKGWWQRVQRKAQVEGT